jgi:hypothetical protein
VTLSRHGQMTTVASSDETIAQTDRDQYATGQGPCLAAAAEGRGFHVESLAAETRWPEFIPRAIQGGDKQHPLDAPAGCDRGPVARGSSSTV